ncbi:(Fe-S)-binding protein [Antribacter gilvus]|uniref:(Fe-S)-binding protein n=1 Tax=Antribacter gilvus TaxID=2304675 RepID=UPI000F7B896F|nr:(Fe-S)-binding protein [Antribacter gilvus]
MRIALAATCIADAMFPQAPAATVTLLERLGHEVVFPAGQACCGQMHVNTGYAREAVPVIRNHVETFAPVLDGEWDAIVVPSGSCTGSIRHQQASVCRRAGFDELAGTAAAVAEHTYELSELLVDVLGVTDVGAWFPHRVTYHPTCHSLRMLRVGDRPMRLLRAVADLDLAELGGAEGCCGFGGTFAVKNAPTSAAMLDDKVASIRATQAEVVTAGDWSCLMHIGGGLSRQGTGIRPMHLAEILASTREAPVALPDVVGAASGGRVTSDPARPGRHAAPEDAR